MDIERIRKVKTKREENGEMVVVKLKVKKYMIFMEKEKS